ncbi:putative DNA-binding protein [Aquabacterium commune]|uniref:Putative DNA-binding protein n=1 Tax=Aquabacterium commune TaxID=70586 RepID=A0A4V3CW12_9BURK|nr:DNA-binding domain-containing protein [Aquabacterium commune]TDP84568.1 putative DNA-binding protein [Aquabacterium commune]
MNQASFAAALLDPDLPCPAGLTVWNGSDPTRRLAVHRNNVVVSLVDALADTFPVTQQLVGEDFFRAMARAFVLQSPPTSPVMVFYGEALPDFIADFGPAQALPCLADMARLEMARVRACHAADAPLLTQAGIDMALSHAGRVDELRLVCHPSVALCQSRHAVVSLWAAHQDEAQLDQLASLDLAQPESALVLRQALDVVVVPVPHGAAQFTQALLAHQGLAQAAAHAVAADAHFNLTETLRLLLAQGAITSIFQPPGDAP